MQRLCLTLPQYTKRPYWSLLLTEKIVRVNGRFWKRLQNFSIVSDEGNVQLLGESRVVGVVG